MPSLLEKNFYESEIYIIILLFLINNTITCVIRLSYDITLLIENNKTMRNNSAFLLTYKHNPAFKKQR